MLMTREQNGLINSQMNSVACDTATTPEQAVHNAPFMGAMELLAAGLENVDTATLRQSIDPIWQSLESLDAAAMLDLKRTDKGARLSDG